MNVPEELIYGLLFGAALLFQYLMKRLAPQPQPQPSSPQHEPDPEVAEHKLAGLEGPPGLGAFQTRPDRSPLRGTAPASARHRFSRKALLANRRDVQNAIVIATIIGPCRGFEPHEVR